MIGDLGEVSLVVRESRMTRAAQLYDPLSMCALSFPLYSMPGTLEELIGENKIRAQERRQVFLKRMDKISIDRVATPGNCVRSGQKFTSWESYANLGVMQQ